MATFEQERSQEGGNCPLPIPKVPPKIFRAVKLSMCMPQKYFGANHRYRLRYLLHNLIEPDQSTVVHQLSMFNQM